MSKCCHDLDLITWMKSGVAPMRVASFGGNMQFQPRNAPESAGTRCLLDCPVEESCSYSARKLYIDHPERWRFYVWEEFEHVEDVTIDDKIESLKIDNEFGKCAWKSDRDVVDHQSAVIEFEDGSTATHNLVGGSSRPARVIHLVGIEGEIQGDFESSRFTIRHIDNSPGSEYTEEVIDLTQGGDMHGAFGGHGGDDELLVENFFRVATGEEASLSTTTLEDSVNGYLIGFCADMAMEEHRVVDISPQ